MFCKVAPWYAKRFGPAKLFVKDVVRVWTKAEFIALLETYLDWRKQFLDGKGQLQSRYEMNPMVASFMTPDYESAVARRKEIPVPQGPVEAW
jgi:tRNA-dihydrouridine synthase B